MDHTTSKHYELDFHLSTLYMFIWPQYKLIMGLKSIFNLLMLCRGPQAAYKFTVDVLLDQCNEC